MRKCIRCGAEMKEGCAVKIEGKGYGIVMSTEKTLCLRDVSVFHARRYAPSAERFRFILII